MADPTDPTMDPAAAALAAPPPAPATPPALSPEIEALIAERVRVASDAAAAAARRAEQAKARPAAAPAHAPQPPAPAPDDVTAILALRDAFDDVVGDLPIKSAQKSLLRENVMRDRPEDVASYVARFAERAGWNTAPPSAPQPAAPALPSNATPAPAVPSTLRAPPPPTPTVTDSTPILSMSPEARESYRERIGNDAYVAKLGTELVRTRVRL